MVALGNQSPKVFISYSHDCVSHMERVLALADRLRQDGIDCHLDQYETSPSEGWPRWMINQLEAADFVLVVCTEIYNLRFRGKGDAKQGFGANWEGAIITQEIYEAGGRNEKFIPVLFSTEHAPHIPIALQGVTHYVASDLVRYEGLYRHLTNQPGIAKPPLGTLRAMPSLERRQSFPALAVSTTDVARATESISQDNESLSTAQVFEALGRTLQKPTDGWKAWVSATLLVVFLAFPFILPVHAVPPKKLAVLAIACGLIAGLCGFLLAGSVPAVFRASRSPWGRLSKKAGIAFIAIMLVICCWFTRRDIFERDRGILQDSGALATIIEGVLKESGPKAISERLSQEQRRFIVKEQSKALGLDPEEVDKAIRSLGETTDEPYLRGLVALYEQNYPEATRLLGNSLRQRQEEEQAMQAAVADSAFFLGQSLFHAGEYLRATEVFRLAAERRASDSNVLNSLGLCLQKIGDYSNAEKTYKESLHIREDELGPNHPDVAQSLDNLATLYSEVGRYVEAENLFKRSLAIRKSSAASDEVDVATSLNNLGKLYYLERRYNDAEPLFERARRTFENSMGLDFPGVGTILNNLGAVYRAQGKYVDAEKYYKWALPILERALGSSHPEVAITLNNLGELYSVQNRYDEAHSLFQSAMLLMLDKLPENHADLALTLSNIAEIYRRLGKYSDAEQLYERALESFKNAQGEDHPNVAAVLNGLAAVYGAQGKFAAAEERYKQSAEIFVRKWGPDHGDVAITLERYASLLRTMQRPGEAAKVSAEVALIRARNARARTKN